MTLRYTLATVLACAVVAATAVAQPTWTEETSAAAWGGRSGHAVVPFNGGSGEKLWLMAGTGGPYSDFADVYDSDDGETWNYVTDTFNWSGREGMRAVVYDGKIWGLGGRGIPFSVMEYYGGATGDIWHTNDGTNWTQLGFSSRWQGRAFHGAVVFNNRIWVLGGATNNGSVNDVWESPVDPAASLNNNWTQVTSSAAWSARLDHGVVVFDDGSGEKMWVMGGRSNDTTGATVHGDIWHSTDGDSWTPVNVTGPQWSNRWGHTVHAYAGQLWVLGGRDSSGNNLNDVWSSPDGVNWTEVTDSAPWAGRTQHASTVFDGKLWVMGGIGGGSSVWSFDANEEPEITSDPNTSATVNVLYTYDVTATGTPDPQLSLITGPTWLSFNGATLEGTPDAGELGPHSVTIRAENSVGFDEQMFQINVAGIAPSFTSTPVTAATLNVLYEYTAAADGIPAPTLSANDSDPDWPAWLSFNAGTGMLSGTPTDAAHIGTTINIEITAANGQGTDAVQSFQIVVAGIAPTITSSAPTTVPIFEPYSYTIEATGTPAPTFQVTGAPAWLSLSGNVLSGTPDDAIYVGATGNITITASNGQGTDDTEVFQIIVQGVPPEITSSPELSARSGRLYEYTVTATGIPAPTLQVTSTLPSWLNFDPATGLLSGTPELAESTTVDVTIAANNGWTPNAVQSFTISVRGYSSSSDSDSGCSTSDRQSPFGPAVLIALLVALAFIAVRRARDSSAAHR